MKGLLTLFNLTKEKLFIILKEQKLLPLSKKTYEHEFSFELFVSSNKNEIPWKVYKDILLNLYL